MGYVGTKPTDAPLTSADLEDGLVTAAKLATDAVETAKVKDVNVTAGKLAATQDLSTKTITLPATVAGLGTGITNSQLAGSIDVTSKITGVVPAANLGTGTASSTTVLYGDGTFKTEPAYDDDQLQSNVAMLGFKVAVNGSLTRYNLVDQSIDEYFDTSGVDVAASTDASRAASGSNYYYHGATIGGQTSIDTSVSGKTILVCSAATGSIVVGATGDVDILVVAGGASGGAYYGGGGGAGGLIYKSAHELTANTYDWVTGAGGAGQPGGAPGYVGNPGADSTWAINGGATEFTAKGGGGGGMNTLGADDGGSGGGGGIDGSYLSGGSETQTGQSGDSGTYGFGNDGGDGLAGPTYIGGGGGGSGGAGDNASGSAGGNGGVGKDYSTIFGTALGDSGWFASGGGAGYSTNASTPAGSASAGGGTAGGTPDGGASSAAQALTGGGSGGGASGTPSPSGNGGSGIILVRYANGDFDTAGADMTLQSTDVTAVAEPDFGEVVTLIENAAGTATLNTDIKGYVSRDSGTTFTQGTLVDEGTWGTNKKVLGFHDLDISSQPSGTSMCYKITTHNQSASSKETRVYATSIGWR